MKAHTVNKNSSGNCFLGGWCAGGYRMQSIGSPSSADCQRQDVSCQVHQNSQQGICFVGDFFISHFAGQKRFIIFFLKILYNNL